LPWIGGHRTSVGAAARRRQEHDMTRQNSFKRRVRTRMAKTGESYSAARRSLLPRPPAAPEPAAAEPTAAAPEPTPVVAGTRPARAASDASVAAATGRGRDAWYALLDAWGATARRHPEIAAWLVAEHRVAGWWAQTLAGDYERARGMRVAGQLSSGDFGVSASKTVAVGVDRLVRAFVDPALRARWLPGDALRVRPPRAGGAGRSLSAQFAGPDGGRVSLYFTARDAGRAQVSLNHRGLADVEAVARLKVFWRDALADLRRVVETAA
jgi:hypothetical protein